MKDSLFIGSGCGIFVSVDFDSHVLSGDSPQQERLRAQYQTIHVHIITHVWLSK